MEEIPIPPPMFFTFEKTLSKSRSHSVFKIKMKDENYQVVKIFDKRKMDDEFNLENFIVRLRTLKKLDHPNLVQILDIIENDIYIFIFSEYCPNGNCRDLITMGPIGSREVYRISKQITSALRYLHNQGIPHTNLTLENIVLDNLMIPKLINYGYLTNLSSVPYHISNGLDDSERYNYLQSHLTEINYLSPEELNNAARDIFAIDIWHLGICVFSIYTGKFPFQDRSARKVLTNILTQNPESNRLTYQLRHCVDLCLVKNPSHRAKINSIFSDSDKQQYMSLSGSSKTKTLVTMPASINMAPYRPRDSSPGATSSYEASVDPININLIQRIYSQQFLQIQELFQSKERIRTHPHAIGPNDDVIPNHHRHKSVTPVIPRTQILSHKKLISSSLFPNASKTLQPSSSK